MNKAMKEYKEHARRVALLTAGMMRALDAHKGWAMRVKPRSEVRYMVGDLVYAEKQIKLALSFICPLSEAEINYCLKGEGKE